VFGFANAPVAQLDRAPGYEPGGREFESLRAHQFTLSKSSIGSQRSAHGQGDELGLREGCIRRPFDQRLQFWRQRCEQQDGQ
jgi:hypothetical protein